MGGFGLDLYDGRFWTEFIGWEVLDWICRMGGFGLDL
jgi:hypothetical protein